MKQGEETVVCRHIEHAQLLAMDYPNMLTAVAVRNKTIFG